MSSSSDDFEKKRAAAADEFERATNIIDEEKLRAECKSNKEKLEALCKGIKDTLETYKEAQITRSGVMRNISQAGSFARDTIEAIERACKMVANDTKNFAANEKTFLEKNIKPILTKALADAMSEARKQTDPKKITFDPDGEYRNGVLVHCLAACTPKAQQQHTR